MGVWALLLAIQVLIFNALNWNEARFFLPQLSRVFTPYEIHVAGDWRMHLGKNFEVMLRDFVVLDKNYPKDAPPLVKAEHFSLSVPLKSLFARRTVIDSIEFNQARVHLLRDESGKALFHPPQETTQKRGKGLGSVPVFNSVEVHDVTIAFEDRGRRETALMNFDARLRDTSQQKLGPFDLSLLMSLGRNRVVGTGQIVMRQNKKGFDHANVHLEADVGDPAQLLRIIAIPSQRPVSFTGSVALVARPEYVDLQAIRWQTGRSQILMNGTAVFRSDHPYLDAQVHADKLDLRDFESFLPPSRGEKGGKSENAPVFSHKPLHLDALGLMDADLAFDIKNIRSNDALAVLQSLRGKSKLKSRDLTVVLEEAKLAGGHLRLTASVHPEDKDVVHAKTEGRFRHLSLAALSEPFAGKLRKVKVPRGGVIGGDLSGEFDLHTRGRSLHDLAANLDGVVDLALEDGQFNAALVSLLNLNVADALKAVLAKQTGAKVPCVLARLPIENGVIRTEALYAGSGLGEILGDGFIDLGKEVYDIRLATKSESPLAENVLFPLHFKGKFSGGSLDKEEGKRAKAEPIKKVLPHAEERSVQVEQTEETTGCAKELRERYLPPRKAMAH